MAKRKTLRKNKDNWQEAGTRRIVYTHDNKKVSIFPREGGDGFWVALYVNRKHEGFFGSNGMHRYKEQIMRPFDTQDEAKTFAMNLVHETGELQ